MKVYRIELDNGKGPYTLPVWEYSKGVQNVCDDISWAHNGSANHPAPYLDNICTRTEQICGELDRYRFGCVSLVSLVTWFDGFLTRMGEAGFVIGVYESDDVRVGNLHCAFVPGEKVTTVPIAYALEFFTHMV